MDRKVRIRLGLALIFSSMWGHADCIKTFVFMRHAEKNVPFSFGQINCQGENRALALPNVLAAKFGPPAAIYAPNPAITLHDNCSSPNGCCPYSRPLATISPSSVYFSKPVMIPFGAGRLGVPTDYPLPKIKCHGVPPPTPMLQMSQMATTPKGASCGRSYASGAVELAGELLANNAYCGRAVFIAWSHESIPMIAYGLFHVLGLDPTNKIPVWPYGPCLYAYCDPNDCDQQYNFDSLYIVQVNQSSSPPTINIKIDHEGLNGQSTVCPK